MQERKTERSDKSINIEFYLVDAFEIYHFLPLYYLFEKKGFHVRFVAEPTEYNTSGKWFDYDRAVKILETNQAVYSKVCNADCEAAFTTQDAYLLSKYHKKKIHMSYGYSFNENNFFESERSIQGFDYKLVHGQHLCQELQQKSRIPQVFAMGYPKYMWKCPMLFEETFNLEKEIRKKNVNNKPVLLYFPTWDKGSSISWYGEQIMKLRERFFVVTKAHHCTSRLKSEQEHKNILYKISDIVCGGNSNFSEIVKVGNIALCDAMSGAASEVPLLNKNIDLLLLYSPLQENNDFKQEMHDFACCAVRPEELVIKCEETFGCDVYKEKRITMLDRFFQPTDDTCLEGFIEALQMDIQGQETGEYEKNIM
mgnify:CR=1 FL=1